MIEMLHTDCMEYMAGLPDKAFDLAIVDPPYGIGGDALHKDRLKKGSGKLKTRVIQTMNTSWDNNPPTEKYFAELFRVSKNQIIWGGNYFSLPSSRCIIAWDKEQPWENFSQWEMAWTSFDSPASLYRFDNRTGGKIHPTQKPVALYKWLLSRYAKPGDRILDTHGGSGSICIACHDLGYDLTWMELDAYYYKAACERYQTHAAQAFLFEPQEIIQKTYNNEFDLTS
jgi:site-specific DNA-methyltransferase (adenine-specific)